MKHISEEFVAKFVQSDTGYLAKQESNQVPTAETEHSMLSLNGGWGDVSSKKSCYGRMGKVFREFGDICGNRENGQKRRETKTDLGTAQNFFGTSKTILF